MEDNDIQRIDKWLWNVRIFKTRSMATDACKAGKVKMDSNNVKASREIKVGDIITISLNPLIKTVKVTQIPKSRLGAKLVEQHYEDLTPEEEYLRVKTIRETNMEYRKKGLGRPTKKERRSIDLLKNYRNGEW